MISTVLPQVAKSAYRALTVTYATMSGEFAIARRQFGITHDRLPALTINLNTLEHVPFPKEHSLEADLITSFI